MNFYLQSYIFKHRDSSPYIFKHRDSSPFYLFKISSTLQRGNSLPLVPFFSQMNPVHSPMPFLFRITTKILVVTDKVTHCRIDVHQTKKLEKILDSTLTENDTVFLVRGYKRL